MPPMEWPTTSACSTSSDASTARTSMAMRRTPGEPCWAAAMRASARSSATGPGAGTEENPAEPGTDEP